jgi:YbbR domain-containing protein
MGIKKFIFSNFGLKATALLSALLVWILITGRERTYLEKTLEIDVEYFNVLKNAAVQTVRPEKVRMKVKGISTEIKNIVPQDFKLRIDLKDILGTRNFFTEDYLEINKEVQVVSIHPKMIEITIEEFMSKEVPVRVFYKGKMRRGIKLIDRKISPEKVGIFGYKSKIMGIDTVYALHSVDLSGIVKTRTIKIPLKKTEEIIRFEGAEEVEVTVQVEIPDEKDAGK